MSGAEENEKKVTIANDVVVTKYKMAGEMVNRKYRRACLFPNHTSHIYTSTWS